jgi:hypothetical protein
MQGGEHFDERTQRTGPQQNAMFLRAAPGQYRNF